MWVPRLFPALEVSPPETKVPENKETPAGAGAVGATLALFGLESGDRSDVTEVDWIGLPSPVTPPVTPHLAQPFVVVADHVEREAIVVETATRGCYRKGVISTQVSLIELLLFCERAKRRGHTRAKLVIIANLD